MNRETTEGTLIAEGAWHQIDLPLRWGDMDALNHLNNTIYFRVMEEARISILLQAGLKLPDSEAPFWPTPRVISSSPLATRPPCG